MNTAPIHPFVKKLEELFNTRTVCYEKFIHEEVKTSGDAAKVRPQYTLAQGAKALILKCRNVGNSVFIMTVLPGDQKLDNKKLKSLLKCRDFRFASVGEISRITDGIEIGGIPPFGNMFGIPVYVDPTLLENDTLIFNAGDRRVSMALSTSDWKNLVLPIIASLIR